ncbi:hypothetical protein CIT26_24225 [Mesorhizobium temperatum]|uniref:Uncharacterized protein n=1 Tax=Mesorhizobium temperatum TaxID=241416 RepID=A0A271LF68_9HYPH|nr:hypothetical protein CIT26_24225 [Mesorhizobium temperatum]
MTFSKLCITESSAVNEFHRSPEQADTLSTIHALSDRHLRDIDLSRSGTTFAVSEATDSQAPASQPPASRRWWTKVSSGARKLAMLVLLAITLTVLIALAALAYLANVSIVDMRL